VAAGEVERRRRRLARLLLADPVDADAVRTAAADAGVELPATVAALVWEGGGRPLRPRLPAGALVSEEDAGGGGTALIGDPEAPGALTRLERAAGETTAVLGPAVDTLAAGASARRAVSLLELARRGIVDGSGLTRADAHLAALATYGDPGALRDLAAARLRPLEEETPASRARLTETLRSWLDHQGEVGRVADELHVHPQTVRYRLGRLRELFTGALDDPAARFELALALRAAVSEVARPGTDRVTHQGGN
jgi:hypothetical protein